MATEYEHSDKIFPSDVPKVKQSVKHISQQTNSRAGHSKHYITVIYNN